MGSLPPPPEGGVCRCYILWFIYSSLPWEHSAAMQTIPLYVFQECRFFGHFLAFFVFSRSVYCAVMWWWGNRYERRLDPSSFIVVVIAGDLPPILSTISRLTDVLLWLSLTPRCNYIRPSQASEFHTNIIFNVLELIDTIIISSIT